MTTPVPTSSTAHLDQVRQNYSSSYPFGSDSSPISLLAEHLSVYDDPAMVLPLSKMFGHLQSERASPTSLRPLHQAVDHMTRNRVRRDGTGRRVQHGFSKHGDVHDHDGEEMYGKKYGYREVIEMDDHGIGMRQSEGTEGRTYGHGCSRRTSTGTSSGESEAESGSYIDLSPDLDPDDLDFQPSYLAREATTHDISTSPVPALVSDFGSLDPVSPPAIKICAIPELGFRYGAGSGYVPTRIASAGRYGRPMRNCLERRVTDEARISGRASHIFHPDLHVASNHASNIGMFGTMREDETTLTGWEGTGLKARKLEQWRQDLMVYAEDDG